MYTSIAENKNVFSERLKESLLMAGSLILSGNPPEIFRFPGGPYCLVNYLNNLAHRLIHLSNFLKKLDSCSASGVHSLSGGAFTTFPRKFGPEKFFIRPGGSR